MASKFSKLVVKSAIPVAKPVGPGLPVKAVAEEDLPVDTRSPWEVHGWGISIAIHSLLLLVMALWYFSTKPNQVKTFDTRLAGSELGVDDGLTSLGGLDNPMPMPELAPSTVATESPLSRLQATETPTNPLAGLTSSGNVGAGNGDGFGLAKFGSGGEEVRGVKVKVGDPQFTLLWDSKADIDIHVIEPGGREIYWQERKGIRGGELDIDNEVGFGPENIYWMKQNPDGSKEPGPGPPGEYRWWVTYYGGNNGIVVPTRWKVRIKHEGRIELYQGILTVPMDQNRRFGPGSRSKTYTLTVGPPGPENGTMPNFKP